MQEHEPLSVPMLTCLTNRIQRSAWDEFIRLVSSLAAFLTDQTFPDMQSYHNTMNTVLTRMFVPIINRFMARESATSEAQYLATKVLEGAEPGISSWISAMNVMNITTYEPEGLGGVSHPTSINTSSSGQQARNCVDKTSSTFIGYR